MTTAQPTSPAGAPAAVSLSEQYRTPHVPGMLYTRIHGKWYDLRAFRKSHPGGTFALDSAAGRDATCLFESYHPFTPRSKLDAILKRYEVPQDEAKRLRTVEEEQPGLPPVDDLFDWPEGGTEFQRELKREVKQFFEAEAKRRGVSLRAAMKNTPKRNAQLCLVGVLALVSLYKLITTGSWVYATTTPFLGWIMSVNVFHDASHFAISTNPRINTFCGYLFPYFQSPSTWSLQHIIGHHNYPNLAHLDPDVAHTRAQRRDHPQLDWLPAHEDQWRWYRLAPHLLLAVTFGLNIANEIETALSKSYNDAVPVGPRSLVRHALHAFSRAATAFILLTWPWTVMPADVSSGLSFGYKLAIALLPTMFFSFMFMLNTQVNHLTPDHISASSRDWYKHQIVTAQNFGPPGSLFHFWLSGGLNHQLEHHVFPGVAQEHLPRLQQIILPICEKHGVKYTMASGYIEAARNYLAHTANMAVKPKAD